MGDARRRTSPFQRSSFFGQAPLRLLDTYGRDLTKGDLVSVPHIQSPHMQIVDIVPNLDPGAPPNTMKVALQMMVVMGVRASVPVREITLVRTAEEQGIGVEAPPSGEDAPADEATAPALGEAPKLVVVE